MKILHDSRANLNIPRQYKCECDSIIEYIPKTDAACTLVDDKPSWGFRCPVCGAKCEESQNLILTTNPVYFHETVSRIFP